MCVCVCVHVYTRMQEKELHSALKAQMPGLLQALEHTKAQLEAKESEVLRLEGTANVSVRCISIHT